MQTKEKTLRPPKIIPKTDNPTVRYNLTHPPKPKKTKPNDKKKEERAKIWAIDFDGTLHFGRYPNIGPANEDLINVLKLARTMGVRLILWTSREGEALDEAVEWCKGYGLEFDALNDNLPEVSELFGYNSRKIGADLFIDDCAMPWRKGSDALSRLLQAL